MPRGVKIAGISTLFLLGALLGTGGSNPTALFLITTSLALTINVLFLWMLFVGARAFVIWVRKWRIVRRPDSPEAVEAQLRQPAPAVATEPNQSPLDNLDGRSARQRIAELLYYVLGSVPVLYLFLVEDSFRHFFHEKICYFYPSIAPLFFMNCP